MSKIRKLIIALLAACTAVCAGLAVSACSDKNSDYPDFRNVTTTTGNGDEYGNGSYMITVVSEGGLPLNGVRLSVKKNGSTVVSGISINGKVYFEIDPDEYEIVIDTSTLPAGYYIDENNDYITSAEDKEFVVAIPSKVIETTATSGTAYQLGDVMYDFSFTEASSGERFLLSDLVSEYKAVLLNFWYVECSPCRSEFPAIEEVYRDFSDNIAIVALSSQNGSAQIAEFKKELNLTFYMASDLAGITNLFGVSNFPTSVIVDRYGVIAYMSVGSEPNTSVWRSLFGVYTSDDYVQQAPAESDTGESTDPTLQKPDISMPESSLIAAAINGEGTTGKVGSFYPEKDDEYSWPWVIKNENDEDFNYIEGSSYVTASNSGVPGSWAILYTDVTLNSGDVLSFDYYTDIETTDVFYVIINHNSNYTKEYSGKSYGWQTEHAIYIADHTVTINIAFCYMRYSTTVGIADGCTDTVSVANINITNVSGVTVATDQRLSVVDTDNLNGGIPSHKIVAMNPADGYYHLLNADGTYGALLLADILYTTPWTELHLDDPNIFVEGITREASLYNISFWLMSNYDNKDENAELKFDYGDTNFDFDASENIILNYYLESFSDNGLTPVTEELKLAMTAFTKEYCRLNNITWYEDQWYEFCYYYVHYGPAHKDGNCFETINPVLGLDWSCSIPVEAETVVNANITKILNLGDGGGLKYTFVAPTSGVYCISTDSTSADVFPRIIVHREDGSFTDYDYDVSYDRFANKSNDITLYCYVEEGETIYIQAAMSYASDTGAYKFSVNYVGSYYEYLRTCTTGDGAWTWLLDEEGNAVTDASGNVVFVYISVPVGLNPDDGLYYTLDGYDFSDSVVYIDFIHPNYMDTNDRTLLDMINAGRFDFSSSLDNNYTSRMLEFYAQSIEGKDEDDELYGLLEANEELVTIINKLIKQVYDSGPESRAWLMFACYYEYYGTPEAD